MNSVSLEAHKLVAGDRRKQYGDPKPLFDLIAKLWSNILNLSISAKQVAMCMVLLKLARETIHPKRDNRIDMCGYTNIIDELQLIVERDNIQLEFSERKIKIYISGPMTGLPNWNYPAFYEAEEFLTNCGFEVLNPARSFGSDTSRPRKDYMRKAFELLLQADAVYLLSGWENSTGAIREVEDAMELELDFYYQE